ncbi:flagellar biosynthesis regulator FlaF [Pedomonas mirosovicensis]|uniref:flagellar biosynthesis regulator FlaF n=1 Tax=Pedomonas mirosovicensis TaxID=2908641 RepID=UPI00216A71E8|nr:flagellar biosynthesis regulator FlaF [Pedomonas mirosovicensis]MCH8685093.1 flagellar biosynthesis regulator FlaF [Pedomonas mirosovicensis]
MSLQAYRRIQQVAESPRQTEYRLFAQVTGALIKAQETKATGGALMEALDWNRRLWSTLSTDCGSPENKLPKELRAQIISLGLWVNRYTSEVMRNKADIDALIDVNKAIMEGLAMQAQIAAQANPQPISAQV